jgi:uncharacterized damage-inducible protein DinB
MKTSIALALFACATAAHAQSIGIKDQLLKHYLTSKDLTLAVADAMPAGDYNFKATPAEMSFGEQMNHIALAAGNYCSRALGTENPVPKSTDSSKPAAIKNLNTAYDYCITGLRRLDDAALSKEIGPIGPRQMSVFELLLGGFTHTAHHRGQAEVYLRLKGITPPEYKF